jgi:hypothetical protein
LPVERLGDTQSKPQAKGSIKKKEEGSSTVKVLCVVDVGVV